MPSQGASSGSGWPSGERWPSKSPSRGRLFARARRDGGAPAGIGFGVRHFLGGRLSPACPVRAVFTGRVGVPFPDGRRLSGGLGLSFGSAGMKVINHAGATTFFMKIVHAGAAGIVGSCRYRCCSKNGKRGDCESGAFHVSPRIVTAPSRRTRLAGSRLQVEATGGNDGARQPKPIRIFILINAGNSDCTSAPANQRMTPSKMRAGIPASTAFIKNVTRCTKGTSKRRTVAGGG